MKLEKFLGGWLCCYGTMCLVRDYHGKEAYIQLVKDKWVDPSLTVPLSIWMIILGLWVFLIKFP